MESLAKEFELAINQYESGNLSMALQSFAELYSKHPENAEICFNFGNILIDSGNDDLALELYANFIQKQNSHFKIWFNLGYIFQKKNDIQNAIASYENVIKLNPQLPEPYKNLASIYQDIDDLTKAEEYFNKALELNPDNASLYYNLGVIYSKNSAYYKSNDYLKKAEELSPNDDYILLQMGNNYEKLEDYQNAINCYSKAVELNPFKIESLNNLGYIYYQYYKNYVKAAHYYEKALELIDKTDTKTAYAIYNNVANIYYTQRNIENAIKYYQKAYELNPDDHISSYNYGKTLILNGDYINGFNIYDICRKSYPQLSSMFPDNILPIWKGEDLTDKTILIYERAGFGDTFAFSRYIFELKKIAKHIICITKNEVYDLIKYNYGQIADVLKENELKSIENIDYQIPFMFCPHAFKTTIESIPLTKGYLKPNPDRIKKFLKYFNTNKLKVGIVWKSKGDIRDIPFEYLNFLESIPEIEIYSLQKGLENENLGNITDLGSIFEDFSDTAAALSQLDLVIATDMAIPNLSGAMGIETWLLLSYQQDWRWGFNKKNAPWFDSVKVFTQDKNNDWESAINKIKIKMQEFIFK